MTRRILLIEDEPLSQDILASLLQGQGYSVDIAGDGFAAIERARSARYDAALVDYHLPDMDGYALGRVLREQHAGDAGLVLIGLTADRNGLAARRGSDAVFRAILAKPIKPAELFTAIERLCSAEAEAVAEPVPADAGARSPEQTRHAAASIWRMQGLTDAPKAFACPTPNADQQAALGLCFELVAADKAEIVLLLERHGITEATHVARYGAAPHRPIVGLNADHADICDLLFSVEDGATWRLLAKAMGAVAPVPSALPESTEPVVTFPASRQVAPAPLPAEEAEPLPQSQPAVGQLVPALHQLLRDGIGAPLGRLRTSLAGGDDKAEDLLLLDEVMVVVGTITEALRPREEATGKSVFDPRELAENAFAMIRDSRSAHTPPPSCVITGRAPRSLRGDIHLLSQALLMLLDDSCPSGRETSLALRIAYEGGALQLTLTRLGEVEPETGGVLELLRYLRRSALNRLVSLMGGSLIDHAEWQGLTLSVPVERIEEGSTAPSALHGGPRRILLVDDAATGGQLLALLLTQRDFHVCRVRDAAAARVACSEADHDMIMVDLSSAAETRLNDLETLRRVLASEAGVPVLAVAQDLTGNDRIELDRLGLAGVLAKPFTPASLDLALAAHRPDSETESSLAPVDETVRAALAEDLGEDAIRRLTAQLLGEIEDMLGAPNPDESVVRRLVELSGSAAVLGLREIAACCAAPQRQSRLPSAIGRLRSVLATARLTAA